MSAAAVLLVDDDAPIRRMLARTLTAEGYAVSAVGDGGAALALRDELRRDGDEPLRDKVARSRLAVAHARVSRAEHELILESRARD